ncbi:MAG: AAA family ATPase [Alistipes indistinctus]
MYYERIIDNYLSEWASRDVRKPVLLRGARQVGKSTAVRHLGEQFDSYVEINFEKQPEYKSCFKVIWMLCVLFLKWLPCMANLYRPARPCRFSTRYKHVQKRSCRFAFPRRHARPSRYCCRVTFRICTGGVADFRVGRIHSMFMYSMTFDEFLKASGEQLLMDARDRASATEPVPGTAPRQTDRIAASLHAYRRNARSCR